MKQPQRWVHKLDKEKAIILSNGKVVGDPCVWNVANDKNSSKNKVTYSSTLPMA